MLQHAAILLSLAAATAAVATNSANPRPSDEHRKGLKQDKQGMATRARVAVGAAAAHPLTQLALVVTDTNTSACPVGLTRIRTLAGWDGDLNSGAHEPPAWTAQCGAALGAACSATKLPGANESCIDCLTANTAKLLAANCTQDSAVAWCSSTSVGPISFLCTGTEHSAEGVHPITDIVAFSVRKL